VLSDGKPWLITAAHLLGQCEAQPPCQVCDPPNACTPGPPAAKLNQCPHYEGQLLGQPPSTGTILPVGRASRWTQTAPNSYASDSAAAFMDNNSIEGDGSLSADRRLERYPYTFTGYESAPMKNDPVTIVGAASDIVSGTNVYVYSATVATVTEYGENAVSPPACLGANDANYATNQFAIHGVTQSGDSGATILDSQGRVIGLGTGGNSTYTYATVASKIRSVQGFDAWYGTQTINDNTLGVFDPATAQWYADNGKWDGCTSGVPTTTQDQCFGVFGVAGDIPVTGDWDWNGSITRGVYHRGSNPEYFQLTNGSVGGVVNITVNTGPPSFGYQPVAGDWSGGTRGGTKVGVFRATTGDWYLDNGSNFAEGCNPGPDTCFNTADPVNPQNPSSELYTRAGDIPIAGDWNGNGLVGVGVYRPSTGNFYFKNYLTTGPMNTKSYMVG